MLVILDFQSQLSYLGSQASAAPNYSPGDLDCAGLTAIIALPANQGGATMPENRIRIAPNTVAYADDETKKLVVEFAIPGAPTDTIDLKVLADSVHLTAPARDIEYVAALALAWPVKPDKAEALYEHGLLRIEVPFKDPMEDAVKVSIKTGGAETKKIKA